MRAVVFLLFSLTVVAPLLIGCDRNAHKLYSEAQKLWIDGRYQEATSKLLVLIEEENESGEAAAKALFRLGEIHYLNLEEPDKALGYFSRAAKATSEEDIGLAAYDYIAEIYLESKADFDLAILQYERIINEFQGLVAEDKYRFKIGAAYYKKEDYRQAIIEYQELLDNFPDSPFTFRSLFQVANSYYYLGKSGEALARYKKLLAKNTDDKYDYDLRLGVAICYEELDQLEKAKDAYDDLIKRYKKRPILVSKAASVAKRIEKNLKKGNSGR